MFGLLRNFCRVQTFCWLQRVVFIDSWILSNKIQPGLSRLAITFVYFFVYLFVCPFVSPMDTIKTFFRIHSRELAITRISK